MIKLTLLLFGLIGACLPGLAQTHLSPPDGELGVPGLLPGSFVISWEDTQGAVAYEYVLTDNSQCFAGCAGDTRQKKTSALSAVEFELREDALYYWITRVYFANGDTSGWSKISHFIAITPPVGKLLSLFPNPVTTGSPLFVRIDWGADAAIRSIRLEIWDLQGRKIPAEWLFRPEQTALRYEDFPINLEGVGAGIYFARVYLNKGGNEVETLIFPLVFRP